MKHFTNISPGIGCNFIVTCLCGHESNIAGNREFAEDCAYRHTKEMIEVELFTNEELHFLQDSILRQPSVRYAFDNSENKFATSLQAKISWLQSRRSFFHEAVHN